jgi:uncharacterized protein (DUF305 family)
MRVRIALVAVASVVAAGMLLGGCSGGEEREAGPKATVLVPGRPGEANKTEVRGPEPVKPPTAEEVRFVQMMIPHHRQALEMSAPAPAQASDQQVKSLADRISAAQKVEIASMEAWLKTNARAASAAPSGGHGGHGGASATATSHANMPGMATPEQMRRLKAARGAEFDRLFLTLMITHHQGALTMAKDVLDKGTDVVVQELARDVQAGQGAEINRMRGVLNGL